jgi:luciferase family oxidoreductase group 1
MAAIPTTPALGVVTRPRATSRPAISTVLCRSVRPVPRVGPGGAAATGRRQTGAVPSLPLSVLDLAMVGRGRTSADALRDATLAGQAAERLGYTRFWVAEHHNMPAVASTAPAVLMAHVAASTSTIKVGSGGVMLPNHAPLAVAEQFAMLEALHPGRIDLGIGRAPGSDPGTAMALRRTGDLSAEDFPRDLVDVLALLGDERAAEACRVGRLRATPLATSFPSVVLLGSSDFSARLAGALGLPFAFAHHFAGGNTRVACELYRRAFEPSPTLHEPYLIVTAGVLVAPTHEEAYHLAGPSHLLRLGLRTGNLRPLLHPDDAAADPDRVLAASMAGDQIMGPPDEAVDRLHALADDTGAAELMVTAATYGVEERIRSLELLAAAWS